MLTKTYSSNEMKFLLTLKRILTYRTGVYIFQKHDYKKKIQGSHTKTSKLKNLEDLQRSQKVSLQVTSFLRSMIFFIVRKLRSSLNMF